ncbi:5-formyltetrahydrofolate cyclo-ligase [bacterium]|nr:5-formyltetrahydrofolate cyclo-ligase [bacterium]
MKKEEARIFFRQRRKALSKKEEKSKKIKERLFSLPEFKKAKTILFYLSTPNEVGTLEMIKEAFKEGKEIAVPVVRGRNLVISKLLDLAKVKRGAFGILEPEEERPLSPREIELAIIPGVAFDETCARLGQGKGYYDRFLAEIKGKLPLIGLCFEAQVSAKKLPREDHDLLLDKVITEKRIFKQIFS